MSNPITLEYMKIFLKGLVITNADVDEFVKYPDLGIHLKSSEIIFNILYHLGSKHDEVQTFLTKHKENILTSIVCILTAKHASVLPLSKRKMTPYQCFIKKMTPKLNALEAKQYGIKKSYVRNILRWMWRGPQMVSLHDTYVKIVRLNKLKPLTIEEKQKYSKLKY